MLLLHEVGFNVVGISVDNAAENRRFYKAFIVTKSGGHQLNIHLLVARFFDLTHVIKNIYYNLLTRKIFKLPGLPPIVPISLTATFSDIAAVYDEERQIPLRIAHKLSETVLHPTTIEKVN